MMLLWSFKLNGNKSQLINVIYLGGESLVIPQLCYFKF